MTTPLAPLVTADYHILVVDDNSELRTLLVMRLRREAFRVTAASSAQEALETVRLQRLPHLAIIEMLLPGMDGLALATELRRLGDVAILFLSTLTDPHIKQEAWAHVAADYLTKPFSLVELSASVRRLLLRITLADAAPGEVVIDERLQVNFSQRYARLDGRRIPLTPIESRLLALLYQRRGCVVAPGHLLAVAWGAARPGTPASLWVHLHRLRNKLEPDPAHARYILTVRRRGYALPPASVTVVSPEPGDPASGIR
jgi:DNA-binding response OmpR family regulator